MNKLKKISYKTYILLILGLVTLVFGILASRAIAENSLTDKNATLKSNNSELNNSVSRLDVNAINKSNFDSIIITLELIENEVNSQTYAYPTTIERLWFSVESQNLTTKTDKIMQSNNNLLISVNEHRNNLENLKQFINYSAIDDFAQLGLDSSNDMERIARTDEGLVRTESTVNNNDLKLLINGLKEKLEEFETDYNIQKWDLYVIETQDTILSILLDKQLSIVNVYNNTYNLLLYD